MRRVGNDAAAEGFSSVGIGLERMGMPGTSEATRCQESWGTFPYPGDAALSGPHGDSRDTLSALCGAGFLLSLSDAEGARRVDIFEPEQVALVMGRSQV